MAPEPADGAFVLAKAARRCARWLRLPADVFHAATGLAYKSDAVPQPGSREWVSCLDLVRLGGRLERTLGRRGVVCAWLRRRNLALAPTPLDVLAGPGGLEALVAYLDKFER